MNVKIYTEGGGDSKEEHIRCREGFRRLIEKAGFTRRMPQFVPCDGRASAYNRFRTASAIGDKDTYPMLLVDSEDPVQTQVSALESARAWDHLKLRDQWDRPAGAADDQAQLMVTCMETWIMADRAALRSVFGAGLQASALLPETDLETRPRDVVQGALEHATRACGRERAYRKGRRSFQVLAQLNPETLQKHLLYFRRFVDALDRRLEEAEP